MAALITTGAAEFAAAGPHGKLAGLDVGTKTIGLAICDACWHFAGPAEKIRRTKFMNDLEQLSALHQQDFGGRTLTVNLAKPREQRPPRPRRW